MVYRVDVCQLSLVAQLLDLRLDLARIPATALLLLQSCVLLLPLI